MIGILAASLPGKKTAEILLDAGAIVPAVP